VHDFHFYVYLFSLHISGEYVPIVRRSNYIYATPGTCYSVRMTVWYAYQTVHQVIWYAYQTVIHTE